MKKATYRTMAAFGLLAGLAGIEHGIGEVLQGNRPPPAVVFLSWPDSDFFSILGGEPAMSLIPNLLVSGALTILLSLAFIAWVTVFIERKHGALVLALLSTLLLLVGGGFGPPLLGYILSVAAARIRPSAQAQSRFASHGMRSLLGNIWPLALVAGLAAWLLLFPGLGLLYSFFGVENEILVVWVIASAFGTLLLALFSAFAYDTNSV